jgi:serine/threonine-protein kinase RsbW
MRTPSTEHPDPTRRPQVDGHRPSAAPSSSGAGRSLRLELPACAESVPSIRHLVAEMASRHGASTPLLADIRLAVTEACANVVVHAYDRGDPGELTVAANVSGSRLTVDVSDTGRGLAAASPNPGLGQGLSLIAALTDEFVIRSAGRIGVSMVLAFELGGG